MFNISYESPLGRTFYSHLLTTLTKGGTKYGTSKQGRRRGLVGGRGRDHSSSLSGAANVSSIAVMSSSLSSEGSRLRTGAGVIGLAGTPRARLAGTPRARLAGTPRAHGSRPELEVVPALRFGATSTSSPGCHTVSCRKL